MIIIYCVFTKHELRFTKIIIKNTAMPRVTRQQTAVNVETIKDVSARLFRERGLDGVSVTQLMAAAGLTHGGFYGHFASKDALAALACTHAFAQSVQRRSAMRETFIARYLSHAHRDDPGRGCPASALAADVGREPDAAPVRQAYADGIKVMADDLDFLSVANARAQRRCDTLVGLATLVGAITLARATRGDPISAEILAAVRTAMAAPHEPSQV